VAAITLTQDWVGDVCTQIPIPFLPWIVAVVTTYGMFMYFFDIDLREAIASVIVVRLVHWVALILIFASIMTAIVGGAAAVDLSVPAAALAPGDPKDEADMDDDDPADFQNMPANFQNFDNN
jgi:hypothetical protein